MNGPRWPRPERSTLPGCWRRRRMRCTGGTCRWPARSPTASSPVTGEWIRCTPCRPPRSVWPRRCWVGGNRAAPGSNCSRRSPSRRGWTNWRQSRCRGRTGRRRPVDRRTLSMMKCVDRRAADPPPPVTTARNRYCGGRRRANRRPLLGHRPVSARPSVTAKQTRADRSRVHGRMIRTTGNAVRTSHPEPRAW